MMVVVMVVVVAKIKADGDLIERKGRLPALNQKR